MNAAAKAALAAGRGVRKAEREQQARERLKLLPLAKQVQVLMRKLSNVQKLSESDLLGLINKLSE